MKMRWYEKVVLAVMLGAWVCGAQAGYRWLVLVGLGGKEVAYKVSRDAGWVFVNDAGPMDALNICEDVWGQQYDLFNAHGYIPKDGGP